MGKNKDFRFSNQWNTSRWEEAKEKLYYLHDNRFIYLENRLQNGSFAAPNKNNLANLEFSRASLNYLFRVEIRSWAMIHLN